MASRAARWVDEVFPRVAVRQIVLTVPWKRRWLLARKPELVKDVIRIGLNEVFRWYKRRAHQRGLLHPKCGSVTVVQRFGSALNLNVHFHCLVMDGVYAMDPKTRNIGFHRFGKMTTKEVSALIVRITTKAERWLDKRGYGQHDEVFDDPDDAMGVIQGASITGRAATCRRAGQKARRIQRIKGREFKLPSMCATYRGYNLHAGVVVGARSRKGLEGLCRYIMRPPLAKDRLHRLGDGSYELRLKTPWADGTTSLRLTAMEVMERLASLVPPPRAHQVIYHGLFAARSRWRKHVMPLYTKQMKQKRLEKMANKLSKGVGGCTTYYNTSWAYLLRRVFGVEGFGCPQCGEVMMLRAVSVLPPLAMTLLDAMNWRGPPLWVGFIDA